MRRLAANLRNHAPLLLSWFSGKNKGLVLGGLSLDKQEPITSPLGHWPVHILANQATIQSFFTTGHSTNYFPDSCGGSSTVPDRIHLAKCSRRQLLRSAVIGFALGLERLPRPPRRLHLFNSW